MFIERGGGIFCRTGEASRGQHGDHKTRSQRLHPCGRTDLIVCVLKSLRQRGMIERLA
jgi:hypothetical protein